MRMSNAKRSALYAAIRNPIMDARIALKLAAKDDVLVAQIEPEIWRRIEMVLALRNTVEEKK